MVRACRDIRRTRWPDSRYAFRAKQMLEEISTSSHAASYNITRQELDITRFLKPRPGTQAYPGGPDTTMTTTASATMPVISIVADCLPEAWEKAVLAVWDQGYEVKTQYDKPDDPPSKDATVMIAVTDPFDEPRIHKNFPGGPEELEAYRQEVVGGIHDHWIDPAAGKWTYTYHERLFAYRPVEDLRNPNGAKPFQAVNQIQYIIDCAVQDRPHPPGPGRHLDAHRRPARRTTRPACSGSGAGWSRRTRAAGCCT